MATALYRRYRPDSFAQMIGQSHVTEPLMAALRNGKVGHAYLFSGPRGCGKTTSARILARCLNCAEGPTDQPCGVCESCVELSRDGGGSIDVVEIDAASHGSVEDARDLRERATFAPARDRYKIFIIDEAHMVTSHGFNALLKIVEEPPEHLKFIFATTEPEKVLGTIRSRTHHYPFRLIPPAQLIDYTQQLADSEHISVEPGVLPLLVRAGGGSARDTLSILDQLIAGSEGAQVRLDRAAALLGFTSGELIDEVISALAAGDAARVFQGIDQVVQSGQDPRRFTDDLLQRLRDLIVVNATDVDGAAGVLRGVPEDQLQRMFEQAQSFARGELSRIADIVNDALDHMAGASAPRMQLELMVARVLSRVRGGAVQQPSQQAPAQTTSTQSAAAQVTPQQDRAPRPQSEAEQPGRPSVSENAPAAAPTAPPEAAPTQPPPAQAPQPSAAQALRQVRAFLEEDDAAQSQSRSQSQSQPQQNVPAQPASPPAAPQPQANGGDVRNQLQSEMDRISTAPPSTAFLQQQDAPTQPDQPQAAAQAQPAQTTQPSQSTQPAQPARPARPAEPDTATAGAPPADPQDNSAPQSPVRHEAAQDVPNESHATPGIDDLREVWGDVLEELIHANRAAYTAVDAITPLALDDDILRIGLTSESDLDAFKRDGANPLREALFEALGVQLRYVPVKISVQAAREHRTPGDATTTPPNDDSDDPHRGQENEDQPVSRNDFGSAAGPSNDPADDPKNDSMFDPAHDPLLARVAQVTAHVPPAPQVNTAETEPRRDTPQAQNSVNGPEFTAAASEADAPNTESATPSAPTRKLTAAERAAALGLAAGGSMPTPRQTPATAGQPSTASAAGAPDTAVPTTDPAQSMPEFVRYGEAVIREIFNATLVDERPLPESEE